MSDTITNVKYLANNEALTEILKNNNRMFNNALKIKTNKINIFACANNLINEKGRSNVISENSLKPVKNQTITIWKTVSIFAVGISLALGLIFHKKANPQNLTKYLRSKVKQINNEKRLFEANWNSVKESIAQSKFKPTMKAEGLENYTELSETEKVITAYVGADFNRAVNMYIRYGKNHSYYEWFAKHGLNDITIKKYKEALKYSLKNNPDIATYSGTTYRWQRGGTFVELFGNVKEGQIISDPSFVSTSKNISGADYFRRDLNRTGIVPELIIIEGENGKIIPNKLSGFRSSEQEVLYNADTKYEFRGIKDIISSDELGLTEYITRLKSRRIDSADFYPCKAIYLKEVIT